MGQHSRFSPTFRTAARHALLLCAFSVLGAFCVTGVARASSFDAQERQREEKIDKECLEEARKMQNSFPEAYRNLCTPAALRSSRAREQYYRHLAPKKMWVTTLDGLESPAAKAANGYAYDADSRYARLLPLLRAQPLIWGDPGTKAVLRVLHDLAERESWVGSDNDGRKDEKERGKNDCARFAALLSDAESFLNAPGEAPLNIAAAARIMEGAFSDSVNYVHTSPLWGSCGDEALHLKAADLLVRAQKEARAKQDDNRYGAGIRFNPLMRAYHTAMTKTADPGRKALWYAESVRYYAGETLTPGEIPEFLFWRQRFEPTGTYEAGKKILDEFNEQYRDNVRKSGVWNHTGNLYDVFPRYRSAYYYLYARTGDKRALEAMLPTVCANGPAMERNKLFFEAEIALMLGKYEEGFRLFARYMAERGRRDEMYFINSDKDYFPGYDKERHLSYRVWQGGGGSRNPMEKQTNSLGELLGEYKNALRAECLKWERPAGPLSREEDACAINVAAGMQVREAQ